MKWRIAILMAALALPASQAADDGKADAKKMEGTWDIVSLIILRSDKTGDKGQPDQVVIKDGKMTFLTKGKAVPTFDKLPIKLDAKKEPKALDVVRPKEEVLPCIYEVSKDDLKLAMPMLPGKPDPKVKLPRPTSFDTKRKPVMVLTAKRGKA